MNIVAHNLLAMNTSRCLNINSKNKARAAEKLSSGYRINRASDDAAGLSISEKMRRQIRGLNQGTDNTQDGISICQVADGALAEVNDMLHRITELSVQSANGTNSDTDRKVIQEEINQILSEINRISDTTDFNTMPLFKDENIKDGSITDAGDVETPSKNILYALDLSGTCDATKEIEILANESGLSIEGISYNWSEFDDGNGHKLSDAIIKAGTYTLNHDGIKFDFSVKEGEKKDNIIQSFNGMKINVSVVTSTRPQKNYSLSTLTGRTGNVPVDKIGGEVTLRADGTGMWIESEFGSMFDISKQPWLAAHDTYETFLEDGTVKKGQHYFKI